MLRIDESHSFAPRIACVCKSIQKAILLKEIYGWCHINLTNKKHDWGGVGWTYMSSRAFAEKFPYMSNKSIQRWLKELEQQNWIVATSVFNKKRYDKTKWFCINFMWYDRVVSGKTESLPQNEAWCLKMRQTLPQNEECMPQNEQPIPTSTTTSTINNSIEGVNENFDLKVEEEKHRYQLQMESDIFFTEQLQKKTKFTREKIDQLTADFVAEKQALEESHFNYKAWKKNLYYWMLKKVPFQNKTVKHETRKNNRSPITVTDQATAAQVAANLISKRRSRKHGLWPTEN